MRSLSLLAGRLVFAAIIIFTYKTDKLHLKSQSQQKLSVLSSDISSTNSVDPDQTSTGAV